MKTVGQLISELEKFDKHLPVVCTNIGEMGDADAPDPQIKPGTINDDGEWEYHPRGVIFAVSLS